MAYNFNDFMSGVQTPKAQWSAGIVFERTNALPLDKWSLFKTEAELAAYITAGNAGTNNCYPGQYVAVVDGTNRKVIPYIIGSDSEGNLVKQAFGEADGKTIELLNGALQLYGIDEAPALTFPQKQADGSLAWKTINEIIEGAENTTYEIKSEELENEGGIKVTLDASDDSDSNVTLNVYTQSQADAKVAAAVKEEADRAKGAEEALGKRIDAIDFIDSEELTKALEPYAESANVYTKTETETKINDAVKGILGEDVDEAYNTLKEIQNILEGTDGEAIDGLIESVDKNKNDIADEIDRATQAEEDLGERIGVLEKLHEDNEYATTGDVEAAQGAAATDATNKANAAEANAKSHADGLNTAMNTRVEALEKLHTDNEYATTGDVSTAVNDAKTELKGTASDASTAETIAGAKKHADEVAQTKAEAAQQAAEETAKAYTDAEIKKVHNKTIVGESETNGNIVVDGSEVKVYELPAEVVFENEVQGLVDFTGYATETWVNNKGYATETWVNNKNYTTMAAVEGKGYITKADSDKADEDIKTWVGQQNYTTMSAVEGKGYATQQSLTEAQTNLQKKIDAVDELADKGIADAAAAQTKANTNETEINTLKGTVAGHTTSIGKNTEDIAGLSGTVESHGTRLGTAEGKISILETKVTNLTGAFIFKGEVESNPTASGFDVSKYTNGDVVIFGDKEYAFDGTKFIELGDEGSYLTKTTAEADYLKKTDAANTYVPKSAFETLRDTTVPAAAKTAEWASVSGKPALSHVETKEETFSSSKVIEVTSGKIRNIEVYDADGEQVIVEVVRNSASKYTLNAVGSTETLTVVYDIVTDIA